MATIKLNSDDILNSIKIAGHDISSSKIYYYYGVGKNELDYICFSKEEEILDNVSSKIDVCIPLETKIYDIAYGEDVESPSIKIELILNNYEIKRTAIRTHHCYTNGCLEDTIQKFKNAQKNPVMYHSEKFGDGVGLELNDKQLLIPLPYDKISDVFNDLGIIHKKHFDKIDRLS